MTFRSTKLNFNRVLCVFSMGGHGALVCFLRNPGKYASVSAFAPICNPSECPWGQKAFSGYLGSSRDHWKVYLMSSNCTCKTRCRLYYNSPEICLSLFAQTASRKSCWIVSGDVSNCSYQLSILPLMSSHLISAWQIFYRRKTHPKTIVFS